MQRRSLFAGGAGAVTGAVISGTGALHTAQAHQGRTHIPNTKVVDQNAEVFHFYDDLVKDRVVLINFFYQSCGETCPLVTQNLRTVQDLLGERMGRDIFIYSITLQPIFDQPHILKDYGKLWDVRPGWKFLTGEPDEIEQLRRALGFASIDPAYDLELDNHTGMLRYGNARLDRWAATPALSRPEWIAKAVTSLTGQPMA